MVFSTTSFLFLFLPIVVAGNYLLKATGLRSLFLLLASLAFFAWTQPEYLWILGVSVLVTYIGGLLTGIGRSSQAAGTGGQESPAAVSGTGRSSQAAGTAEQCLQQHNPLQAFFFTAAILINVGLLFYFKYFNFTMDTIGQLMHQPVTFERVALPLGISFFTFSEISYLADVWKGRVPAEKNILTFALYVLLFPKLIQGPIVRYTDLRADLTRCTHPRARKKTQGAAAGIGSLREGNSCAASASSAVTVSDIAAGIRRFIVGLAKKAIIANTLALTADGIWNAGIAQNTVQIAWIGSIAYTLQLYFDFAGYTDMAIGIGRMLGFHFTENFNDPYIAKSISEFWRRWHITLSGWFRDYIYIPLGGNRHAVYRNLAVVFLLTGIWHGSAWRFIFWGMLHGICILAERFLRVHKITLFGRTPHLRGFLAHIYTLMVVNLGWVLFRAPSFREGILYIRTMFGLKLSNAPGFTAAWYMDGFTTCVMIVAIILSTSLPRRIGGWYGGVINGTGRRFAAISFCMLRNLALLLLFAFSILFVVSGSYNSFIYFQF